MIKIKCDRSNCSNRSTIIKNHKCYIDIRKVKCMKQMMLPKADIVFRYWSVSISLLSSFSQSFGV